MLPKVANHLSRAVVSLQSQTGHTIRNVLQSSGSTTAVGGWGSGSSAHGPGPSKFHTSSRFHLQSAPTVSQQAREANEKLKPFRTSIVQKRAQHLAADPTAGDFAAVVRSGLGTYATLINSLTDRDYENHQQLLHLERKQRRRRLASVKEDRTDHQDTQTIASLRDDQHFLSALALFKKATAAPGSKFPLQVYNNLLRSCVIHSDRDAASTVFAHLDARPDISPDAQSYVHLIAIHAKGADLASTESAFDKFKVASRTERVQWTADGLPTVAHPERAAQVVVWNEMLDAYLRCGQPAQALALLETMMDSSAGGAFNPTEVPHPSPLTYTRMIRGFCRTGDVSTALTWFERLLQENTPAGNAYESTAVPQRPEESLWGHMLEALADAGKIAELNRVFARMVEAAPEDKLIVRRHNRETVLAANLAFMDKHPEMEQAQAISLLDFLLEHVQPQPTDIKATFCHRGISRALTTRLVLHYWTRGLTERALEVTEELNDRQLKTIRDYEAESEHDPDTVFTRMEGLREFVVMVSTRILKSTRTQISLPHLLRLAVLFHSLGIATSAQLQQACIDGYALLRAGSTLTDLTVPQWETLLGVVFAAESKFPGTLNAIVDDLLRFSIDITRFSDGVQHKLASTLVWSDANSAQLLSQLGEPFRSRLESLQKPVGVVIPEPQPDHVLPTAAPSPLPTPPRTPSPIRIEKSASHFVGEFFPSSKISPLTAYERLMAGVNKGVYPRVPVLARLISALGRLGEFDKVHEVYGLAQVALGTLEEGSEKQHEGWYIVEDNMIVGLAHAGDVEAAHTHRGRILEHGGKPSADAYAALILHVKDTTDDTSNAMALFNEASALGVQKNLFMYNTAISKLAKARKADYALSLFQEMKGQNVKPTSVTYGAVIAACCRVGDAVSAENLFQEMVAEPTFKPRIPPYNTMMQLYTHTKPDRERVLEYYRALREADVQPTAHTYKLLLDAYGCIEPVDPQAMHETFNALLADRSVTVQGTHWAALINAVGCVQKDLDQALSIFESIATHPSTKKAGSPLPDAVVYEALINTLVTLKRVDLLPTYLQRLEASGIHMTAYIANLLIKGYASIGDIARAREIFEALQDPQDGAAAPYNHAPHQNKQAAPVAPVPPTAPIYREPSTWEAMVRAELGNGQRDRALSLLTRLQARMFPAAVYQRISGIMLDDSVAPWAPSDSLASPTAA